MRNRSDLSEYSSRARPRDIYHAVRPQVHCPNHHRGIHIPARAVILVPGKCPTEDWSEGEEKFIGHGLSVCSTCDGPLFKGKVVAIVGGGKSALTTAVQMSNIAREVHLIVRSRIKADEVYLKIYAEKKNIITHTDSIISALHGEPLLEGITIRDVIRGQKPRSLSKVSLPRSGGNQIQTSLKDSSASTINVRSLGSISTVTQASRGFFDCRRRH